MQVSVRTVLGIGGFAVLTAFGTLAVRAQNLQWHPMPGLHDAAPTAMAVAPDAKVFLACGREYGVSGGVFSSSDNGRSWHLVSLIPQSISIAGLAAVSDSILVAIYIPDGMDYGYGPKPPYGVWQSTDAGRNWHVTLEGRSGSGSRIQNVVYLPGSFVVAVASDSLYMSVDRGSTWQSVSGDPLPQGGTAHVMVLGNSLAFFTDTAAYLTRDLQHWQRLKPPARNVLDMFSMPSGDIAIRTTYDTMYTTSDVGVTWHAVGMKGNPSHFFPNGVCIGSDGYNAARSTDTGRTWTEFQYDYYRGRSPGTTLLGVDSAGSVFVLGPYDVARITDTSLWSQECTPANLSVSSLAVAISGAVAINLGNGGSMTTDDGASWNSIIPQGMGHAWQMWLGYHVRDGFVSEDMYSDADGYGDKVNWYSFLHSSDGHGWGETEHFPGTGTPNVLGFDRDGDIYVVRHDQLLVTSDLGLTYQATSTTLDSARNYPPMVGLPDGSVVLGDSGGVARSRDQGATWEWVPSDQFAGRPVSLAGDSGGVLMASIPWQGVFRSTDEGTHWTSMSEGLPTDSSLGMICYSSEGFWILATAHGVFTLRNGELVWFPQNFGLEDLKVLCVGVAGPRRYYVGTSSQGVFTTTALRSEVQATLDTINGLRLQAYPNPSTQSVTLSMDVPEAGILDVRLFDESGNEIRTLWLAEIQSGYQEIVLHLEEFPRGRYFLLAMSRGSAAILPVILEAP